MIKLLIISVLCVSLIASCSNAPSGDVRTVKVSSTSDEMVWLKEFKRVEFIPLETSPENIVRYFGKVFMKNNKLVTFSMAPDNSVSIHDASGKLLKTIRCIGKGPGEIVFMGDCFVDSLIHIWDATKKLQSYDFEGNFVSSLPFDMYSGNIHLIDNYLISYGSNDRPRTFNDLLIPFRFTVFDLHSPNAPQLVYSDIECNPKRAGFINKLTRNSFCFNNNQIYYWTYPADTIFSVDRTGFKMQPYVLLDLGDRKISQEFMNKPYKDVIDFGMTVYEQKLIHMSDFYKLSKDVYCFAGHGYHLSLDGSHSNEIKAYEKFQIFPLQGVPPVEFNTKKAIVGSVDNNKLLLSWDAGDFLEYCKIARNITSETKWNEMLNIYPGLKHTLEVTTAESNPIVVVLTL